MDIKLSSRLTAIAGLVPHGGVVADIGTDHAHLPIWLVQQGLVPGAIAMDVAAGPLARAEAAIFEAGLSEKIKTRLSDGFAALSPGEAKCAVLAGMGGDLMLRLLEQGEKTVSSLDALILSPQSEIARVRCYLREKGYGIDAEDMVLEDGKYYQMFRARPQGFEERENGNITFKERKKGERAGKKEAEEGKGRDRKAEERADYYGPLLLRDRHPILISYIAWERQIKESILRQLEQSEGEKALERRREVLSDLERNREAARVLGV